MLLNFLSKGKNNQSNEGESKSKLIEFDILMLVEEMIWPSLLTTIFDIVFVLLYMVVLLFKGDFVVAHQLVQILWRFGVYKKGTFHFSKICNEWFANESNILD